MNFSRPLIVLSLALAGCSRDARRTAAARGREIGGPFALTDQDGKPVTDRTSRANIASCISATPSAPMSARPPRRRSARRCARSTRAIPALAAKVVPVFITVDPERDTPAVLKQFVRAFHPRLVGLTGSADAIADGREANTACSRPRESRPPSGGYLVDHTNAAYLMDPDGKPLALLPPTRAPRRSPTRSSAG